MITRHRLLKAVVVITTIAAVAGASPFLKSISEKTCGHYIKGEGQLALCIESVVPWGKDIIQVNGYLENTGPVKLCDLQIEMESPDRLFSIWPEWARDHVIVDNWAPKQSTSIGLTAPYQADGTFPHITVKDFNVCGAASSDEPLAMAVVDIGVVKPPVPAKPEPMEGRRLSSDNINHNHQEHLANHYGRDAAKRVLEAVPPSHPVPPAQSRPIKANECAIYTNGNAELTLCLESIVKWGSDIQQVRALLYRPAASFQTKDRRLFSPSTYLLTSLSFNPCSTT